MYSKFTGEHPCRSVISIKLLCNFIEITFWHGCSPVNLLYIFRTPFLKNTFGRLVLKRVALGTYSCFLVILLISDIFVWKFRTIPNTFLLQHFCFTWDLDISPRMISENTGFCWHVFSPTLAYLTQCLLEGFTLKFTNSFKKFSFNKTW